MQELAGALRRIDHAKMRPSETHTILIVEDDDTLRSVLEMGLTSEGYRVIVAGSGREGIRLAAEHSPHLVLLDVTLPGLNGFDVCRELRHSGFNAPIMMVTGRAEEIDRVVGLEPGVLLVPRTARPQFVHRHERRPRDSIGEDRRRAYGTSSNARVVARRGAEVVSRQSFGDGGGS